MKVDKIHHLIRFLVAACVAGFFSFASQATQFYWTGAVDTDFTNPKNWVTGSQTSKTVPSACPQNNDYSDPVYFTDRAPEDKRTVNLPGERWMGQVNVIGSTGWKFTGSVMKSKKFYAEGTDLGLMAEFARI